MIPVWATLRISWHSHGFRLWIPLFLIWLILLPIALLLLPIFLIACLVTLINPLRALRIFWQILSSLKGTKIDIQDNNHTVYIAIS